MYKWGDFPDYAIKLNFLDVGEGHAYDGWIHEKIVPFVIVAQAISGTYEVTSPNGIATATDGEVFLTLPNSPLKILHSCKPQQDFMLFRYIHIKFTLFETIDIFSLYSLPLKVDREKGMQIGLMIEELLQIKAENHRKFQLSTIARRNEIAFRLLNELLNMSQLLEENAVNFQAYEYIAPVLSFIRTHLADPITLEDLLNQLAISRSSLFQFFKKYFNSTPMDYVKTVRLNEAYQRLCYTDWSIARIAEETGFSNPFHFSREFKKNFQKSPLQTRILHKELYNNEKL